MTEKQSSKWTCTCCSQSGASALRLQLNDSLCCTATSGLHCFAQQVNKTCESIRVLWAGLPYALREQALSHSQLLAELLLKNMSKVLSFNFALAFIHICVPFSVLPAKSESAIWCGNKTSKSGQLNHRCCDAADRLFRMGHASSS